MSTDLNKKSSCRPERRTTLVAPELNRYGINIVALSEIRIKRDGQFEEIGDGYNFSFVLQWKAQEGALGVVCNSVRCFLLS